MAALKELINSYALLGVARDADEVTIRRAYRKRALELHPDKNPDNPKAEELFMAIKVASDVLLDKQQRGELDAKLAAQDAAAARFRSMDDARARMREQLEVREKAAAVASRAAGHVAAAQQAEVDRLRRQGRDAQEAYAAQLHASRVAASTGQGEGLGVGAAPSHRPRPGAEDFDVAAAVLVRWTTEVASRMGEERSSGPHPSSTTVSERQLRSLFKLYGTLVVVTSRKARSACLVFDSVEAAEAAVAVPPDGFRVTRLKHEEAQGGGGDPPPHPQHAEGRGDAGVVGVKRGRTEAEPAGQPPVVQQRGPRADGARGGGGVTAAGLWGGGGGTLEHVPSVRTVLARETAVLATMQRLAAAQP